MLVGRHVGDLGNLQADKKGRAVLRFTDQILSLQGSNNVIGRAVVVSSLYVCVSHARSQTFRSE